MAGKEGVSKYIIPTPNYFDTNKDQNFHENQTPQNTPSNNKVKGGLNYNLEDIDFNKYKNAEEDDEEDNRFKNNHSKQFCDNIYIGIGKKGIHNEGSEVRLCDNIFCNKCSSKVVIKDTYYSCKCSSQLASEEPKSIKDYDLDWDCDGH